MSAVGGFDQGVDRDVHRDVHRDVDWVTCSNALPLDLLSSLLAASSQQPATADHHNEALPPGRQPTVPRPPPNPDMKSHWQGAVQSNGEISNCHRTDVIHTIAKSGQ